MFNLKNKNFDSSKEIIKDNGKLISKDIGLIEDAWNVVVNLVHIESHCLNSFHSTNDADEKWLERLEEARKIRTELLNLITKLESNGWCYNKHLAVVSGGMQELVTRFLTMGDKENARKYSKFHKWCYETFLESNGYLDIKPEVNSSA